MSTLCAMTELRLAREPRWVDSYDERMLGWSIAPCQQPAPHPASSVRPLDLP